MTLLAHYQLLCTRHLFLGSLLSSLGDLASASLFGLLDTLDDTVAGVSIA